MQTSAQACSAQACFWRVNVDGDGIMVGDVVVDKVFKGTAIVIVC